MPTTPCGISRLRHRGFTLIELLVVIAIIAILAVVVVLVLNPGQLLAQARDGSRLSDLTTINKALSMYGIDQAAGASLGVPKTEYLSLPDISSSCTNLGLPTLPASSTYGCVSSTPLRESNGPGWIPVNFGNISAGNPLGTCDISTRCSSL